MFENNKTAEPKDEHIRLMFRAAKGDQVAYASIYEIYRPAVSNYLLSLNGQCRRHDLEDMTQEVFFRGWKKADKFQGKSSVKTYLNGFAKNVWYEFLNRYTVEDSKHQKLVQEHGKIGTAPPPEETLCDREAIRKLKKVIGNLSKKQQQVVYFILEDGDMSMTKAAQRDGLSRSTYRTRLSVVVRSLREVCNRDDFM